MTDDLPHGDALVEEWVFTCWTPDAAVGVLTGYRRHRTAAPAWYWSAVARRGEPLLHVTEWEVPRRSDPLLVKAHSLWAEHVCDVPMEQWTVANETYAAALDDPDDALGRAYGQPSPVAVDMEWYATEPPRPVADGFVQEGVAHAVIELAGGPLHLSEVPARRWRRWGESLGALDLPDAYAHTGLRAPFAFPSGEIVDWVLTPDGWRSRAGGEATALRG